jgi:hypothetical protein
MATRITIELEDKAVKIHVTDDTGRDDTARVPRYPAVGSEDYVTMVDKLDVLMYRFKVEEGRS